LRWLIYGRISVQHIITLANQHNILLNFQIHITMTSLVIFLQASGGGGGYLQLVLLVGMILVFWLFMIRPQAKKAKQAKTFQENLQKGDKIVTIAGIHGRVNKMNEDGTIDLGTSPGSYMKIEKSAISMEMTANVNKVTTATPVK
jgi:preprotein translocase subunit YajC